jgi:hypothetical protein
MKKKNLMNEQVTTAAVFWLCYQTCKKAFPNETGALTKAARTEPK